MSIIGKVITAIYLVGSAVKNCCDSCREEHEPQRPVELINKQDYDEDYINELCKLKKDYAFRKSAGFNELQAKWTLDQCYDLESREDHYRFMKYHPEEWKHYSKIKEDAEQTLGV